MKNRIFGPLLLLIVIVVVLIVFMTAVAAKADAPTSPSEVAEENPYIHPPGWNPYAFMDELGWFYESLGTITTSTTVPEQVQNTTNNVEVPEYRNDHSDRWDQLAQCESGGDWGTNTGNGFGGGLQFMHGRGYSTWLSFGGGEYAPNPWDASREQQIAVAEKVLASSGFKAWPGCSRKFGWL